MLQTKPLVQRRVAPDEGGSAAPPKVHEVMRSPGRPLDQDTRDFMESRFGHDFSQIRVHTNAAASASAKAVDAVAYVVGKDMVFREGEYAPTTHAGKNLLAHELVHTIQQGSSADVLQRVCDLALLDGGTDPVYFPHEPIIVRVFRGLRTLRRSSRRRAAIGLIQQALVDLGYDLGTSGPNGDGVDRRFGETTEAGITAFQTAEAIPGVLAGVLDQPTLKCLDDRRSRLTIPSHQTGIVTPWDVEVGGQEPGGRDEDIFFARGSSTLDIPDRAKIRRLLTRPVNPLKGCNITLEGYVSEDELVEFGPSLAADRISAVDAEFAAQHHDDAGPDCPTPVPPLRTPSPLPAVSSGVSAYRERRKVEVVPVGEASTTAPCPPGSPQHRALTGPENTVLTNAIDKAVDWMDIAIRKLIPDNEAGDDALTAYFGGTDKRDDIRKNLKTWRKHLNDVVRTKNRHGTQCNSACRTATAFNQGRGPSAQMTVCPRFFQTLTIHPPLDQDKKKAFVVMHEAGHGSLGTEDTAYGHRRLIEFISHYPDLAKNNTDSYTLMVLCLNDVESYKAPPTTTDNMLGMSGAEEIQTRRGLAWLQTWLIWAQQDTSHLYDQMSVARQSGQGLGEVNTFYASVYEVLVAAFNVHRPPGDPPPTFSEQGLVAVILDRLIPMREASDAGLRVEKDTSVPPLDHKFFGPGDHLILTDAYFLLTTDRQRVEYLLPLIIEANLAINPAQEPVYENFIKEDVRVNRHNRP